MEKPSLVQLDTHRKEGFRPGVVLCLLYNKKVLMVYKKAHKLWQLPQGRINNHEDPHAALARTAKEEMGDDLASQLDYKAAEFVDVDQMEFKPGRHNVETIKDDSGQEINMLGKVYYFVSVPSNTQEVNIFKTQFDEYFWMSYREALFLAERIYQKGKKRVTMKVLTKLFKLGSIT